MKMKETIKPIPFDMGMDVSKIKGHVRIELTDPKTGEVEVREADNMMTNAMAEYFQNCGFLNFPNVDLNNMVIDLLGGVMAFDQPIDDDPTIVHVPAGCKMTCNGSVGAVNSSISPSELGSWVNDPEVSGWIADNVYQQTYSYLEQQGNGTISTVCLTGKNYGYAGEGNCRSQVKHSTKTNITGLSGTRTAYSGIPGYVFNLNLTDSTCYSFAIESVVVEEQTVKKGFLRKYRLPISKIDLNSTRTAPILLSEEEVTIDSDLENATWIAEPHGQNLLLWNVIGHGGSADPPKNWGTTWTQYLWTLTPAGVLSKETVVNTTGEALHGLQAAHFIGNYCFFVDAFSWEYSYGGHCVIATNKIYVWDRSTGDMTSITNPYGCYECGSKYTPWYQQYSSAGWAIQHSVPEGRFVTTGGYPFICDFVNGECYPNNADTTSLGDSYEADSLIRYNGSNLYRDQTYIASIFEVDPPIVKDATRTMKIIYTITFPTGGESNA